MAWEPSFNQSLRKRCVNTLSTSFNQLNWNSKPHIRMKSIHNFGTQQQLETKTPIVIVKWKM